ncbi:Dyp-type peroxidase family protein [Burkholderia pseudomallei MSHR7500]|uniref:Dyp-type peroxidase n=1 Tax=Burkholderia pseudomallei TaxID=28450 RepID=UPI000530C831|nr:Dyp-type peroxidase [Burkholderia pseudomallei]KGS83868.1 Dyp-type peroxidase family protein [Burkholderia pseudomallei MSHR7500]
MSDRTLDVEDIQGDILGGFNTDIQEFLGFAIAGPDGAGKVATWLATLAPQVSSVAQVSRERDAMKAVPASPELTWLAIAISHTLLKSAAPDVTILDEAFSAGMAARAASALADRSSPSSWVVGASGKPIDVLLKVAANSEGAVRTKADALAIAAAANGLALTYRETGRRLNNNAEHFGFRDGISQPDVVGYQSAVGLMPGYFLFGYPTVAGGIPPQWAIDSRNVTDNGSLVVFRRLVQDVVAFENFCAAQANALRGQWPGLRGEQLAALIVGRWPSGAPAHPDVPADPGVAGDPDNSFNFLGDLEGATCPFGAHIRKVNPRKGPGDFVDIPRLLRRGIPFGPTVADDPEAERGLFFVAYQASIVRGFEFISGQWMNSHDRPSGHSGDDMLVGRPFDSRSVPIKHGTVAITVSNSQAQQWIRPTGGAYLFAPSKAGLRRLADSVAN